MKWFNKIILPLVIITAPIVGQAQTEETSDLYREVHWVDLAKNDLAAIARAIDMYHVDCGEIPYQLEDLTSPPSQCKNWGPDPYIKTGFLDPWGNRYDYRRTDKDHFTLRSLGADNREGGVGEEMDLSVINE